MDTYMVAICLNVYFSRISRSGVFSGVVKNGRGPERDKQEDKEINRKKDEKNNSFAPCFVSPVDGFGKNV